MLATVGALLVGLAIVGLILSMRRSGSTKALVDDEKHPWAVVAERLNMRFGPGVRVHGLSGGVYIDMVRELPENGEEARTRITTNVLKPAEIDVLRRDWEGDATPSVEGVFTLDHRFDGMFEVFGDEGEGVAILDDATRKHCVDTFLRGDVRVSGGVVSWLQEELGKPDHLEAVLVRLIQLARRFGWDSRTPAAKLLDNACASALDTVRLRNLRLLFTCYPESPEAVGIARTVTAEHDAETRLAAATFLGDTVVLRELAESNCIPRWLRLAAHRHLESLAMEFDLRQ